MIKAAATERQNRLALGNKLMEGRTTTYCGLLREHKASRYSKQDFLLEIQKVGTNTQLPAPEDPEYVGLDSS